MGEERIRRDLSDLAGEFAHRRPCTVGERRAAEFILERLSGLMPGAALDPFGAPDAYYYLFASYYGEFSVIALLASWWPRFALCYGAIVFLAYLAEFLGYGAFSRLIPRIPSQNVIAQLPASREGATFVITAHYDSPPGGVLADPRVAPWLHRAHQILAACMVLVLLSCAADAVGLGGPAVPAIRWAAAGTLLAASMVLFGGAVRDEPAPDEPGNASGVAALLELAGRFAAHPLETADLWFVATGSKEGWMDGMRHVMSVQTFDRETAYFLNLDHVGAGAPHYLTVEGMLYPMAAAPELVAAMDAAAAEGKAATPATMRTRPTDAFIPLARGYKAMTLTSVDASGRPSVGAAPTPIPLTSARVMQAADVAEAALRRLADASG